MAGAFHRHRCRHRQRHGPACSTPAGEHARLRQGRHPPLARGRRHRRAVQQRYLARSLPVAFARPSRQPALRRARSPASASTRPARWSCWARAARRLPVGPSAIPARNIIVWMDHRAIDQARRINAPAHERAALCRRHDLAGDGDAEAALARGKPARRPSPRPGSSST